MKAEALLKLEVLSTYSFFNSVGKPLSADVTNVADWTSAIRHYTSLKWENCRLMAKNVFVEQIYKASWARGQEWNATIDLIQPEISLLTDRIVSKLDVPKVTADKFKPSLCRDLRMICMEHHYSDVVAQPFFSPLLEPWYAAGHLPCGWDGKKFPDDCDGIIREGKLMVF